MPIWLVKYLPYGIVVAITLGGLWYVDHRGYQRAEVEATLRDTQRQLDLSHFNNRLAEQTRTLENSMQTAISNSDANLAQRLSRLDIANKTIIQPTLTKEIRREVRFTDPAAGITDIMRQELNRARSFSEQHPCPAGSNAVACFSLPESGPVRGQ